MTANEIYDQLSSDIDKIVNALNGVRTTEEIHLSRQMPGYEYSDKHMREYWIALGQYSSSAELSYLAQIINANKNLVPFVLQSKQEIENYSQSFKQNKEEIVSVFDSIVNHPNQVFIGYAQPITMEEHLNRIADRINDESNNLDFNYKELKK